MSTSSSGGGMGDHLKQIYEQMSLPSEILLTDTTVDSVKAGDCLRLVPEHDPDHGRAIGLYDSSDKHAGYLDPAKSLGIGDLIDSKLIVSPIVFVSGTRASKYGDARLPCEIKFSVLPQHVRIVDEVVSSKDTRKLSARPKRIADDRLDKIFAGVRKVGSNMGNQIEQIDVSSIVTTNLMEHQNVALRWLLQSEQSEDLPPYWKADAADGTFQNVLTGERRKQKPEPLHGGVFADQSGLGKTVVMIALMAATSRTTNVTGEVGAKRRRLDSSKSTLVICTPSLIKGWISQIEEHTKKGIFKVYEYYGKRTGDKEKLLEYDVVITTYSTIAAELDKDSSPIKEISWSRVVLDEAHTIKNITTRQSKAITALKAHRRWVLTGMEIEKNLFDVQPLMAFLRYYPFASETHWVSLLKSYEQNNKEAALLRLQNLLGAISLKRTKEMINLPLKTVSVHYVDLSSKAQYFYEKLQGEIKSSIVQFGGQEAILLKYSTVLQYVLRLRQFCVDLDREVPFQASPFEDASAPNMLKKLAEMVQDGDFSCPICMDTMHEVMITSCCHYFCRICIETVLSSQRSVCPICRGALAEEHLFHAPKLPVLDDMRSLSEKGEALLKLLKKKNEEDPSSKCVVFSQFSKVLVRLERSLKEKGLKVVRLDLEMSLSKRSEVVKAFSLAAPHAPTVLLANMKVADTGVDLKAASTVYLFDPWWNQSAEDRAVDRVHRLGQRKEINVVRLIVKDSIEVKLLELKAAYPDLFTGALRSKTDEGDQRALKKSLSMLLGLSDGYW